MSHTITKPRTYYVLPTINIRFLSISPPTNITQKHIPKYPTNISNKHTRPNTTTISTMKTSSQTPQLHYKNMDIKLIYDNFDIDSQSFQDLRELLLDAPNSKTVSNTENLKIISNTQKLDRVDLMTIRINVNIINNIKKIYLKVQSNFNYITLIFIFHLNFFY